MHKSLSTNGYWRSCHTAVCALWATHTGILGWSQANAFACKMLLWFHPYLVLVLLNSLTFCSRFVENVLLSFASKFIYIYEMHSFRLSLGLMFHLRGFSSFAEQSLEDMKQTVIESQTSETLQRAHSLLFLSFQRKWRNVKSEYLTTGHIRKFSTVTSVLIWCIIHPLQLLRESELLLFLIENSR